eukprot:CAMPEP_0177691048 /NCGR_PEP_ID=MMETSP0484_2-20121128/1093_1 /TAXON_ID=354590 /ORGANISM="Rhodomonas lens, Strain RHODO" /LENGTH=349 /DNA_ID=CAMNT_0019201635 /DNA_START=27 /DNA_END=1073 /DNA_ORIENTATION=-
MASVPVLYTKPYSNHGGRLLVIIYKKNLNDAQILIKSPEELGGTASEQYLKLSPQGKVPLLITEHGAVPESDTIARYLLERFGGEGPTFTPSTLEARTRSNLVARLHDTYIAPIQGCMYEAEPPFGTFAARSKAIAELQRQWQVIEDAVDPQGPFLAGPELSLADATVFPTVAFLSVMAPKFAPAGTVWDAAQFFGRRVHAACQHLLQDPAFARVWEGVQGALQEWDQREHWKGMLHAGLRDNDAPTIFNRIIAKKVPSEVVYEDEDVLVFKDINPQAPTHLLLIPKERLLLSQLRFASPEHKSILGTLLFTAAKVSKMLRLGGFRVVINDGAEAQQSVFHLHLHLLSG